MAQVLDISSSVRGALTAEAATLLAAPVLREGRDDFEKIVLSSWAFSVEAAEVFAGVIAAQKSLKSAILSDIIAGRPEAEGLRVYEVLSAALKDKALVQIDLSDNAVGPKGVAACRELLTSQESLQQLSFCNCGISAEAALSLSELLLFRSPTNLRVLHFFNNMSGNGGAVAIASVLRASPLLEDFRFSSTRVGSEGGLAFAQALQGLGQLKRLDLNDNTFGKAAGVALGRALEGKAHLEAVDLGDTSIEDAGALAVATALAAGHSPLLRTVNLCQNDITVKGVREITAIFASLPMCSVNLEDNESEDDSGGSSSDDE